MTNVIHKGENVMADIYMGKVSGIHGTENMEAYLNGDRSAQVVTPNRADFPSRLVKSVNLGDMDDPRRAEKMANAADTAEFATYFFYADDLNELRDAIEILCNQPTGEDALERLAEGEELQAGDLFASNKVSMMVVSLDSKKLEKMVRDGNAELREGEYYIDKSCTEKDVVSEVAIGVKGMEQLIDNGKILAFGDLEDGMNRKGLFGDGIDEYRNVTSLNPNYKTELVIDNAEATDTKIETKEDNAKIKELTDYIVRLKDAFKEGMLDKETYESFVADANEQLSKERGETTADRVKDHILNKDMMQKDEIDMEDDYESILDDNERENE